MGISEEKQPRGLRDRLDIIRSRTIEKLGYLVMRAKTMMNPVALIEPAETYANQLPDNLSIEPSLIQPDVINSRLSAFETNLAAEASRHRLEVTIIG